jgi:hypothetical protein
MSISRREFEMATKDFKIMILATHGFEQSELEVPLGELKERGATVHVVSLEPGEIKGWDEDDWGSPVAVDKVISDVSADEYDALVLPGGQINPDLLRVEEKAVHQGRPPPFSRPKAMLTTIALPHDWCGYGDVIAGFKAKYPGITEGQRAEPRSPARPMKSSRHQGQQGQHRPAGARRDRRRSLLRPRGQGRRPAAALQGLDLGDDPGPKPRTPKATGTATITACCRSS